MRTLKVNTSDVSYAKLKNIAERSGFRIKQRKRHCRVETEQGIWITNIPRHTKIKRPTAKGIAERFNKFGGNIEII